MASDASGILILFFLLFTKFLKKSGSFTEARNDFFWKLCVADIETGGRRFLRC